jgi:DNA-directed RNA polymerase subunit L
MADEQPQSNGPEQQIQLMLDDREVEAVYANSYRIFEMMDEVFIELGYNMPHPHQQQPPAAAGQPQQPQILLKMTHRLIMNRGVVKRLASTLSQMIKRYEQQFGEIPIQGQPPQRR